MEKFREHLKDFIEKYVIKDFPLKFLSFIVAFLLWLNITAKQTTRIEIIRNIEIRNFPKGYFIKSIEPISAKIVIEGQRIYINSSPYFSVSTYIDASKIKEGENILPIHIENANFSKNVKIISIVPENVILIVEKMKKNKVRKRKQR